MKNIQKKKKTEKIKYHFNCPIFNDDIYLFIGSKEKANAFCRDLNITDKHLGKTAEIADTNSLLPEGFLVWVKEPEMYYTIVHECLHLTRLIFAYHGVPFNETNDEVMAYYQEFWVEKFWHIMGNLIECKKKGATNASNKRIKSNNLSRQQDQRTNETRPDISKDGNG